MRNSRGGKGFRKEGEWVGYSLLDPPHSSSTLFLEIRIVLANKEKSRRTVGVY